MKAKMKSVIVSLKLVLLNVFLHPAVGDADVIYGIVSVRNAEEKSTYCITYNPRFQELPKSEDNAKSLNLVNLVGSESEELCDLPTFRQSFNASAVAVKRGNCTFSEKAANVQALGGSAVLVVSPFDLHGPAANSSADFNSTRIIVAMIVASDFDHVKALGENVSVRFYAPKTTNYDINLLFIWLTAIFTVTLGSYWSGNVRYQLWLRKLGLGPTTTVRWHDDEEESKGEVPYSPKIIVFVVIIMCAMLLGLYFLYDYLIYVIIVLFALASSCALADVLWLIIKTFVPSITVCRIPQNRIYYFRTRPEVCKLVLLGLCLAIGIWWLIERHKSYAWVLQDILGVAFCLKMLKKVRLPSLKICSIFLILLFVYDIFFVFITPLFTKDGSSVMVDIATGRGSSSGEKLPIVLMFPKMNINEYASCFLPYSLLGFGDIFVPGLLVAFCYGFDLQINSGGIYFFVTSLAYGLGLAITFVALVLMKKGQPALLYLVPCTLLTTFILALMRKEFEQLWSGKPKLLQNSSHASEDVSLSPSERNAVKSDEAAAESSAGEEDLMLVAQ